MENRGVRGKKAVNDSHSSRRVEDVAESGNLNDLAAVCRAACERARAMHRPILASFALEIGTPHLLGLVSNMAREREFLFSWEPPAKGDAMAGGGTALRVCAEGGQRFRKTARRIRAAFKHACTGGVSSRGPYAFGGFAFFDDIDEMQWPGFGAAQLVIPEWMMLRGEGRALGMVNAMVTPRAEPERVAAGMADNAERLRKAARRSQGGGGGISEPGSPEFSPPNDEEGRRNWLRMVSAALEVIRSGRLFKVVLARTVDLLCKEVPSPYPILRHLRKLYPDCFNFMINPGQGQVFLGATPERFARFQDGAVHLSALASTAPRGDTAEQDDALARRLLESSKERAEHQYVVDAILGKIRHLGEVEPLAAPRVLKFSNLQHLYTPITLHPRRPVNAMSIVERLHPTPAVGGHPNEEALRLIRSAEDFDRGWYSGPVGWLNARGEGEFAVALRACTLTGQRIRLFAGNGIVAGSDPEREYLETQLKLRTVLAAVANE